VLLVDGRFVVTDFDGNPILRATERMLPIPAALDVAGMTQSFAHAAVVAGRYTALDAATLAETDALVRSAFLLSYADRIAALGHGGLYDPVALYPFRMQQVLREIIYGARYLPRWMYVPTRHFPLSSMKGPQRETGWFRRRSVPQARGPASAGWCPERTTTCAIRATRMMSFGYWPRCSYPSSWPLGRCRLSGCRPRRRWDTRHRAS
jgi:hypothetical protein